MWWRAAWFTLDMLHQVEWHLGYWSSALFQYGLKHGVRIEAYSPLGGGGTTTGHNGGNLGAESCALQCTAMLVSLMPCAVERYRAR